MIDLKALLEAKFGHPGFRDGQQEAIEAILKGRDVVAVMPTGGGKSLLYQLPGLILPGVTLVVSPLIALMKDQVDQLQARGLPATFINSTLSMREQDQRLEAAAAGRIKLLYLAPERFRNTRFQDALGGLAVSLFAIDEAHCISEWGHDFRPDYHRLAEARKLLGGPPVVALTATATPEVRDDIIARLGLVNPLSLVTGFERKNLFLSVVQTRSDGQKLIETERTIDEASGDGIIYVASRKSAERVAGWLTDRRRKVGIYHAGLDDGARVKVQEAFMSGALPIIVATNAFGMGIDKPDIRFVIHYEFPKSLEAYYQEVGRAGRDHKPALGTLLFSFADKRIQEFFIEGANPGLQLIRAIYRALCERDGEPVHTSDLAREVGSRNEIAVSSAMAILERSGVIEREARGMPGDRRRRCRVITRMAPRELPIDGQSLTRKLAVDQKRLDAVIKFAYHTGCRKERILAYFGERARQRNCGACDQCIGRGERTRVLDDKETAIVEACLKLVGALDGRFGLFRLASLLVGEVDDGTRRHQPAQLPGHGALRHLSKQAVLGWMDALLDAGLLSKEPIGRGDGYVIRLAGSAADVLAGQGLPELAPPRAASSSSRRPRRSTKKKQPQASPPPSDGEGSEPGLVATLKRWRREEAQRRAVPPYLVFHDTVLLRLAAERPRTRAELAAIPGIGPQKLTEYGEALLKALHGS